MKNTWIEDFNLMWGIAPTGTLKHKKGEIVKSFISNLLSEQRKEIEEKPVEKYVMGWFNEPLVEKIQKLSIKKNTSPITLIANILYEYFENHTNT